MKKGILIFLFSCGFLAAQSQSNTAFEKKFLPRETIVYYKLGSTIIQLKIFKYGEAEDVVMVNLHADEISSVMAAHQLLETNGGLLIKIENGNKRNIRFRLGNQNYVVDPNRIFSREGINRSLSELGSTSDVAINEVEKFANRILQLLPENSSCIVALHNNSEGEYSVTSYLPDNKKETDAKKVYVDSLQDPDDLFFTTDNILYYQLAREKYNCILQDNEHVFKDGSLSVYCGEKNIRYLNCETQHGKTEQHFKMLATAMNYIERIKPDADMYASKLASAKGSYIATHNEIYFDEKKIGSVKSITYPESSDYISVKLEIDKNFKLYSNSDFFLLNHSNGNSKIEIRIDPTREKKLLDPRKDVIEIKVREIVL